MMLQKAILQQSHKLLCSITSRFSVRYNFCTKLGSQMDPSWKPGAPCTCRVGDHITTDCTVDTPALMVDMDKLECNLRKLPELMRSYPGVAIRPHAKAHKCPAIAKLQMDYGAVGICVQTLTEAEALVYGGGISDVLLSNELIGKPKLRRLAALAKYSQISVCVDDAQNISDISDVAVETGVTLDLVVEVNVGQDRCGVEPGLPAVALANHIQKLPGVLFKGIQCYNGWNQHIRKYTDRQQAVNLVVDKTKQTIASLQKNGIFCTYVTGGGTGTFPFEAASGVFTEVQPGSYVVMDVDYGKNLDSNNTLVQDFEHSLYILSTIQSVTIPDRAIADAGLKAASLDSGVPTVEGRPDVVFHNGGDEHGILRPGSGFKVGQLIKLIPGHCDPTFNLYDWLVCIRNDKVEHMWPVLGRGPGV